MNSRMPPVVSQPTIELHINELVLHGFATEDRHRVGETVQRELAWLLTEHGLPVALANSNEIERIDGGTFQMGTDSTPEATGDQVARAIFGGFRQ